MTKGQSYECQVHLRVEQMLANGGLGIDPKTCRLCRGKLYESSSVRGGKVQADVSVEVFRPGSEVPMLILIWECKNHSRRIGKHQVKKSFADIQEIGAAKVKGFLVSASDFTLGAVKYAAAHGIGLWVMQVSNEENEGENRGRSYVYNEDDAGLAVRVETSY